MNALLLALLLATSPEAPTSAPPAPIEASAPRRTFWVQPIGTAILGLIPNSAFYLPLGAHLPLGEGSSTSLGVELTLTTGSMRSSHEFTSTRPIPDYWRVLAAAGPVFSLSGRPLSGPFVQPKLITHFSYEPDYIAGDFVSVGGLSAELRLGVDLGWQFTVGNLYLAPVLGVSAGYGFNMPRVGENLEPSRVLHPQLVGYSAKRGTAPVLGVNLNLLRIGAVF